MRLPLRAALAVAATVAAAGLLAVSLPPLILRKEALASGHGRPEARAAARGLAVELAAGGTASDLVAAFARRYRSMDFEVLSASLDVVASSLPGPARYDLSSIADRLQSEGNGEADAESFLAAVPGAGAPRYVLARLRSPFSVSLSRSASAFIYDGALVAAAIAFAVACAGLAAFSLPFARRVSRLARAISSYAPGSPPIAGKAGDETGDIAAAFNGMAARLAAADAARIREEAARRREEEERRESIAGLSHDLRTPLASVLAYSESLVSSSFSGEEERRRYESIIHAKASYMSRLLEGLLVLARLDSAEGGAGAEKFDLAELARAIAVEYLDEAERAGMAVDAELPEGPVLVRAGKEEIGRALRNLIDNAVRYAADGGRLELGLRIEDGRARLEVRDFGPGIAAEERESVFERHYRGFRARAGRDDGLGLGLAIARAAARRSGGELVLEAPEDGGSRFSLIIPLCE